MSPTEDINVPIILQYEQLSHVQCNTWHNKFMAARSTPLNAMHLN